MEINILTLFPQMFDALNMSITGRAAASGKLKINVVDIREYSKNKHKKCDDYPFGGGDGMVMTVQPIFDAVNSIDPHHKCRRIFMSPKGKVLTQKKAGQLSGEQSLLLLCGHYEGVDQRAIDLLMDEELSIGDYILTGGEIAAMVVADCVSRFAGGVLSRPADELEESFTNGLLEYPQYTRPEDFLGHKVPQVLLSGNHAKVDEWRMQMMLKETQQKRPDLYAEYLNNKDNG